MTTPLIVSQFKPAALGDPNYVYVTKVRALMINLPLLDVIPSAVLFPANKDRVFMSIQNVSASGIKGYFSNERNVTSAKRFSISPGAVLNAENAPIAPANAIYMAGDAGCVIEAYEVIRVERAHFDETQW